MPSGKLFVAAIDFGTTYSGYAFSTQHVKDSTKIYTCEWKRGDLTSLKAPTCILLKKGKRVVEENKESNSIKSLKGDKENKGTKIPKVLSEEERHGICFSAFGFDAETKYLSSILPDEETDKYYYFRRFKMLLHNENISLDVKLKDETGKTLPAIFIFAESIYYLRQEILNSLNKTLAGTEEKDIQYVITVPAIWEDKAKFFMRDAALEAGIEKDSLIIALEPEAASIFCQELKTERESDTFTQSIKVGTKYVVVDLGGGTADITVHEMIDEDTLEEVVQPSGGPWGGTAVDDQYIEFLEDIFGSKVLQKLKEEDLEDYTDIIYGFEVKKRSIKVQHSKQDETDIVLTLPQGLIDAVKQYGDHKNVDKTIKASKYKDFVSFTAPQHLHIKPEAFRRLFQNVIDKLLKHLDGLFKKQELTNTKHMILVGGFSECDLVQHAIINKFGKYKKIIIPDEAGLAVLKGAVRYGNQPDKISKRVLRKTYGIQSWPDFDPDLYPKSKKVRINGEDRCKDVFYKFVEKGVKLEPGTRKSQVFEVLKPDEKTLELAVYISNDKNPKFVTDPTCQRLGKLVVDLPNLRPGEKLEVEESLIFGDTELLFTARDLKTGKTFETQFNF